MIASAARVLAMEAMPEGAEGRTSGYMTMAFHSGLLLGPPVGGFVIDRVNDRQRLYFDQNDRRVEIGGCLTESERAWLLVVFQRWLGEPGPPSAFLLSARRDLRNGPT